jgi:hypothetical protein
MFVLNSCLAFVPGNFLQKYFLLNKKKEFLKCNILIFTSSVPLKRL